MLQVYQSIRESPLKVNHGGLARY